jgi:hypothetical protein
VLKESELLRTIATLIILLLVTGWPTAAQEPVTCDEQASLDTITAALEAIAPGDSFATGLLDLQAALSTARLACDGFIISGEPEEGKTSVVMGPYEFPAGLYQVTATTDDFFILSSQELSGDCRVFSQAFGEGDAANGSEELWESEGCELIFEVEARAPWTLQFTPLTGG